MRAQLLFFVSIATSTLIGCKSKPDSSSATAASTAASASTAPAPAASAAPSTSASAKPATSIARTNGPRWLRRIPVDDSAASSQLGKGGAFYPAKRAFDGTRSTMWIESAKGPGNGEWLEAKLKKPRKIWAARIDTGMIDFAASKGDLFGQGSHAKKIRLLVDGKEAAVREVAADERSVWIDLDGSAASTVRWVFDEVYEGKDADLAVTEAAIFGDPTEGTLHDPDELKKAIASIDAHLVKSSSGEALALLSKLGAPILGDQVTDQQAHIKLEEVDLDGKPGNEWVIKLTFEYKLPDPQTEPPTVQKRQIHYAVALGAVEGGKLVYLGAEYLVQEGREDGFDDGGTTVSVMPFHAKGMSDVVLRWGFSGGADAARQSGARVFAFERGAMEPLLDLAFSRVKDSTEKVDMREKCGPPCGLEIVVDNEVKSTLALDAKSFVFKGQ